MWHDIGRPDPEPEWLTDWRHEQNRRKDERVSWLASVAMMAGICAAAWVVIGLVAWSLL